MKFLIVFAIVLAGCARQEAKETYDLTLCNPAKKEAYIVNPALGDTVFLQRFKKLDGECK